MRFLFRLNLSLHADAGKKIGILIFGTKHGERLCLHCIMILPLFVQKELYGYAKSDKQVHY